MAEYVNIETMEELDVEDFTDELDEFLDESQPEIEVAGFTFSPSRILKELDPIAYRAMLLDYVDEKAQDSYDPLTYISEVVSVTDLPKARLEDWGYEYRDYLTKDEAEEIIAAPTLSQAAESEGCSLEEFLNEYPEFEDYEPDERIVF
jgi:hypothetical protein